MSESAKSIEPTGGRVALSEALFRIGALRLGRFTLQEGKTSSYSLDLRVVPSDPEAYALAVTAYFEVLKEMGENSFDAVAGAGTPGVAFSSPVAYLLRKPMVHVKRDDADWRPVLLEGAVKPGWRTVVIGDVADRAGSLASAAEALRRAGCVVREAVVLVDKLEGERTKLKATGVKLNAFTDVRDLVQTLYDQKKVTKAGWQSVQKQTEEKDQ